MHNYYFSIFLQTYKFHCNDKVKRTKNFDSKHYKKDEQYQIQQNQTHNNFLISLPQVKHSPDEVHKDLIKKKNKNKKAIKH